MMTDQTTNMPFFRSFILNRTVRLSEVGQLSNEELDLLNIETKAALAEARHNHAAFEDRTAPDAGQEYRKMKVSGMFQAAIELELAKD
jgi:hypothetical protein